jgi:D-alanyl-D-alanine carboxypeptidase
VGELGHAYSSNIDVSTYFDPSYAWSAGAMVASAGDLALWARALYGGAVLPPASLDAMLTTVETDAAGIEYGLGVMVLDPSVAIETTMGHGGDIPGYHTHMFYVPSKKLSFAAIVNEDGASPNPMTSAVLKHFLQ